MFGFAFSVRCDPVNGHNSQYDCQRKHPCLHSSGPKRACRYIGSGSNFPLKNKGVDWLAKAVEKSASQTIRLISVSKSRPRPMKCPPQHCLPNQRICCRDTDTQVFREKCFGPVFGPLSRLLRSSQQGGCEVSEGVCFLAEMLQLRHRFIREFLLQLP